MSVMKQLAGLKSPLRRTETLIGLGFALPTAIILLALVVYPVLDALRLSFFNVNFFFDIEKFIGLENYREIFRSPNLSRVFTNTLIWSVGSLVGQFGLGLLAALAVNQRVPGVNFFRNLFLLPYVIPAIALALVWRWMLDGSFGIVSYGLQQLGLLAADQSPLAIPKGAMVSVILANVWRGFPFVMVTYWAALQAIDEEQYDAAKVDGANVLQEFFAITLPNLKNATIVLMILRGIWTFTYFDLIWLITRGGPAGATEHWPIWIYQEAMGSLRFGSAAALGVLMALGLFVLIAAYARISGFVSGRDA